MKWTQMTYFHFLGDPEALGSQTPNQSLIITLFAYKLLTVYYVPCSEH